MTKNHLRDFASCARSSRILRIAAATQVSVLSVAAFAATATDLQSVWRKYPERVESLQYECHLERTQLIAKEMSPALGPPTIDSPKTPVTTKSTITFSVSGTKVACNRSGEFASEHSPELNKEVQKRTFDGAENRYLFTGGPMPVGGIESGKIADDALLKHVELFPLWLAYSPFTLLRHENGYIVDQMTIRDNGSHWDGALCTVLSIPTANKDVVCLFYLDASKDYRPIGYEMLNKATVMQSVNMRYVENKISGWSLAGWNSNLFHPNGEPLVSVTGKVQNTKINEPLGGDVFRIDFPEGTHVDWNGKPYIQGPTQLRPLNEKQFRRTGPNDILARSANGRRYVAIVVTSCVVVYLGFAVYKGHKLP